MEGEFPLSDQFQQGFPSAILSHERTERFVEVAAWQIPNPWTSLEASWDLQQCNCFGLLTSCLS